MRVYTMIELDGLVEARVFDNPSSEGGWGTLEDHGKHYNLSLKSSCMRCGKWAPPQPGVKRWSEEAQAYVDSKPDECVVSPRAFHWDGRLMLLLMEEKGISLTRWIKEERDMPNDWEYSGGQVPTTWHACHGIVTCDDMGCGKTCRSHDNPGVAVMLCALAGKDIDVELKLEEE